MQKATPKKPRIKWRTLLIDVAKVVLGFLAGILQKVI